jgi:hypothetical protein
MKQNDTEFLLRLSKILLEQTKEVAEENHISTAAFIRQSISRNIKIYEKTL